VKAFRFVADLEHDPPEAAELWALGCRGMQQVGGEVLAWFDEERPLALAGRWEDEDGTDWVAAYLRDLTPVRLRTLVVAPSHAEVTLRVPERPLWLDPGMAFGTGHHETTRMALAALERVDPRQRRVLDVGAGSGILAIAADLLGAREAVGVDVDEATLPVARDNARLNRSRARFLAGSVDAAGASGTWDVVVANLYAELHARLAPAYRVALAPGGRALLTGILAEREALVQEALADAWRIVGRDEDGPWRLLEAVPR
jgi:ribosomal protein L11 methyltransferase